MLTPAQLLVVLALLTTHPAAPAHIVAAVEQAMQEAYSTRPAADPATQEPTNSTPTPDQGSDPRWL